MQILVVSQYFWPENFRINDLVTELAGLGHDVTVLTGYPNYPSGSVFEDFKKNPEAFQRYGAVRVVRVPLISRGTSALRLLLNYFSFALSACTIGAWRLRSKPFDVIFAFEPSPITVGIPAALMRWLKKAPLVFWVLDLWPETLQAVGVVNSKRVLGAVGVLVSFIYSRCDLILAQSRSFIPQIRKYCLPDSRVDYFPSWSDSTFDFERIEAASEIPPAENQFSILFAGNIGDAQDFPAILQAAAVLKSDRRIRWLIVGDGRSANWVREEIERRELKDNVLMLGRFPVERMASFFKHADALLVSLKDTPIFAMTIPGKLQSYLAAGIPVLAMLNGEGAEIVRRSGAGLACPAGDGHALADAVGRLFAMSREERGAMGEKGLEISSTEFDRRTLISRLITWFESLTRDSKAGHKGIAL
ncbi:MAG: glycosyltransferase family 4 protein [Propionivibrio sp.]